jgi:peptide/nickel transport system permease protein
LRTYLIKRILMFVPTLILLTIIVFAILRVVPGDPALLILGGEEGEEEFTQEQLDALRARLGTDRNIAIQYADWVTGMARLDFGNSYHYNDAVIDDLKQRIPISVELTLLSLLISGVVAIPLGVMSAIKQDTWGDYISRVITLIGLATPNFFVAIMTIFLLIKLFGWIPPLGYVNAWENPWTNFQQLIFPALALGTSGMAFLARVTRSAMLEVLHEDYIRTARSKGLAEGSVIYKHALKNAVLPVVTIFGLALGNAAAGSIVVEIIFSIPGMGRLLIEGVQHRDYPMIQAIIVFFGVMVLLANLLTDIAYAWLNPRIRYT